MTAVVIRFPNVRRGRLEDAERIEIASLAERGWSPGRIAVKLNRHPATVNFHMVTHGLKTISDKPGKSCVRRNGTVVRAFGPEEDAFIVALRVQGYSTTEIARIAGKRYGHERTPTTIGIRLKMLASREVS